ncbi:hypothetical protein DPMN_175961 [Dreissena polymorpha]|uniref:Uncharacterized protein n=1 Tax=Dreissena polymorpha TaxID=45954 RepID=A0A9D4E632_DREPO|nr:hypothetical protein DPMN_175961 [Dreissena polymorpha]
MEEKKCSVDENSDSSRNSFVCRSISFSASSSPNESDSPLEFQVRKKHQNLSGGNKHPHTTIVSNEFYNSSEPQKSPLPIAITVDQISTLKFLKDGQKRDNYYFHVRLQKFYKELGI